MGRLALGARRFRRAGGRRRTDRRGLRLGLNACSGVENEGYADGSEARFDKVGCAIEVRVEHPPTEVAYYYGGISYIWEDGGRQVDLDTTCTSSPAGAFCRDEYAPPVRGPGVRT